jgi:hypothetical protein
MRIRFLLPVVAATVLLAAGCTETAVQAPPTTLAQALGLAARTHKPILIDFATEW